MSEEVLPGQQPTEGEPPVTPAPPTEETVLPPTEETVLPPTEEKVLTPTEEKVLPPTEEKVLPPTEEKVLPPINLADIKGDITKQAIRKKVWDYIEKHNIASFPRPVYKRIPNFKGSNQGCDKLTGMEQFQTAKTIKINPDKPQEQARFLTLQAGKELLVPTPRLSRGLFNKIVPPPECGMDIMRRCATSQGVREHSVPVGLDAKIHIDLVIVGSVAVSKKGLRIGKGEGFGDLEYGMLVTMGAATEKTLVITVVHDCQVMDELPEELFCPYDVTLDFIVTPTRIIECQHLPKPTGIYWNLLSEEKLEQCPVLKMLRYTEQKAGKDVRLKDEETVGELEMPPPIEDTRDENERPPRRRDNRRRRRPRNSQSANDGEGGHSDREEHRSDGEGRPARRFNRRNRQRSKRDSQSEGDAKDETRSGDDSAANGDGKSSGRPNRRRRNPRGRTSESQGSGNEDQREDDQGERRNRNRRFRRQRKSSNQTKENEDPQHSGEDGEKPKRDNRRRRPRGERREGDEDRPRPALNRGNTAAVFVGSIPRNVRVSDFKVQVRDKSVQPLQIVWRGGMRHAFLIFQDLDTAKEAINNLTDVEIDGCKLRIELSNRHKDGENKEENDEKSDVKEETQNAETQNEVQATES